jgi:8-oxo-dGTP diphosphatase
MPDNSTPLLPTDRIINGSLCYIIHDDHVLMIRRARPPHVGKWSAPGGKLELGESPYDCVMREMREETGFTITEPTLRGIVSVTDVAYPIHWLLFIYDSHHFTGNLIQTHEGELRWIPLNRLNDFPMPYADTVYLQHVLQPNAPLFQMRFVYDAPERCIEEVVYTNST